MTDATGNSDHVDPDSSTRDDLGHDNRQVKRFASAPIPTRHGEFTAHAYRGLLDGVEHLALVMGAPSELDAALVRVHSECITGDVLGSLRCDCGSQLDAALARIADEGTGVLLYLRGHEGRGIGLGYKLRAYALQDEGLDTVDANLALGFPPDSRDYAAAAEMLADLGVSGVRLLTNNPAKYDGLGDVGIRVVDRLPLHGATTPENERYLATKRDRMGHLFE